MGLFQLSISRLLLIPSMTCHLENSIHSGTVNTETHFQEVVKCITSTNLKRVKLQKLKKLMDF